MRSVFIKCAPDEARAVIEGCFVKSLQVGCFLIKPAPDGEDEFDKVRIFKSFVGNLKPFQQRLNIYNSTDTETPPHFSYAAFLRQMGPGL